jgi:hypothetical protein
LLLLLIVSRAIFPAINNREAKMANTSETFPQQAPNPTNPVDLKAWLSDWAFAELKAANTIATNGIRTLTVQQRQRLAEQCAHEMPADGTIGYSFRRQEAINRMKAMRRIYLRDTIRHLKHCHKLIQLALSLMTTEQKCEWAAVNEREGVNGEGATRAIERLKVLDKFEDLMPTLYPEQVSA